MGQSVQIWTSLYQFVELDKVVLLFKFGCLIPICCRENETTKLAKRSSNKGQDSLGGYLIAEIA